jgi:hypothetical protein
MNNNRECILIRYARWIAFCAVRQGPKSIRRKTHFYRLMDSVNFDFINDLTRRLYLNLTIDLTLLCGVLTPRIRLLSVFGLEAFLEAKAILGVGVMHRHDGRARFHTPGCLGQSRDLYRAARHGARGSVAANDRLWRPSYGRSTRCRLRSARRNSPYSLCNFRCARTVTERNYSPRHEIIVHRRRERISTKVVPTWDAPDVKNCRQGGATKRWLR